MAIFAEVTEKECVIERHFRTIDTSLICTEACSTSESHCMLSLAYQHYTALVCPSACPSVTLGIPVQPIEMPFASYSRAMIGACFLCCSWVSCYCFLL